MTALTIAIRPDSLKANKGKHMIVIYEQNTLIGVPARGLTLAQAKVTANIVRYASTYAAAWALDQAIAETRRARYAMSVKMEGDA